MSVFAEAAVVVVDPITDLRFAWSRMGQLNSRMTSSLGRTSPKIR